MQDKAIQLKAWLMDKLTQQAAELQTRQINSKKWIINHKTKQQFKLKHPSLKMLNLKMTKADNQPKL